jgi:hypothetical protein
MIDQKTVITLAILACLILITVPFEKRYTRQIAALAANPAARFLAGAVVVLMAAYDVTLAGLAFVVVFMWIADIHLLSNTLITDRK